MFMPTTTTDPSPLSTITKLFQHFSDCYRLKKAIAVFLSKTILQERRLKIINKQHRPSAIVNDKASKLNIHDSSLKAQDLEKAKQSISLKALITY